MMDFTFSLQVQLIQDFRATQHPQQTGYKQPEHDAADPFAAEATGTSAWPDSLTFFPNGILCGSLGILRLITKRRALRLQGSRPKVQILSGLTKTLRKCRSPTLTQHYHKTAFRSYSGTASRLTCSTLNSTLHFAPLSPSLEHVLNISTSIKI